MPFYNQKTIIKTCSKPRSKGEKSQIIHVGSVDFRAGEIMIHVRETCLACANFESRARRGQREGDVLLSISRARNRVLACAKLPRNSSLSRFSYHNP